MSSTGDKVWTLIRVDDEHPLQNQFFSHTDCGLWFVVCAQTAAGQTAVNGHGLDRASIKKVSDIRHQLQQIAAVAGTLTPPEKAVILAGTSRSRSWSLCSVAVFGVVVWCR